MILYVYDIDIFPSIYMLYIYIYIKYIYICVCTTYIFLCIVFVCEHMARKVLLLQKLFVFSQKRVRFGLTVNFLLFHAGECTHTAGIRICLIKNNLFELNIVRKYPRSFQEN